MPILCWVWRDIANLTTEQAPDLIYIKVSRAAFGYHVLTMVQDNWYPTIDPKVCIGCGDCIVACPTGALALSGQLAVVATPEACNYCAVCESVCPVDAIDIPYQIIVEDKSWSN